jgi:hypothetical protein
MAAQLVYLEWVDSAGGQGWQRTEDYTPGLILVRSIGWLMDETEQHVTLAGHLGREDDRAEGDTSQAHGWMTIPKGAITYRRAIRLRPRA